MNTLLFGYLMIGYMQAFNRCMRLERKGIQVDLVTTGIIIMLYLAIWPALCLLDQIAETILHIAYKLSVKEQMKENSHE